MRVFVKMRVCLLLLLFLGSSSSAFAENVTMNFKNADIRAFIEFVSGFSNKNFLIDNRVKGNVTIVSPTPISESEAYDVFLSVLEVNGFAAVDSGTVIKIVPRAESKQKSVAVSASENAPATDAMMTQVLRLKYADAQQLVALLRPLISPNSHLVAYPRGNMLLLTDSASNIRRIQDVLKLVDRQDSVGVQLFPLEHASADKLAKTLSGLYANAGKGSPDAIKALSHQPGNILIVVAAPQMINEVAEVVQKLDIKPEPDSGRLQVRYLKHGNAVDVAKVITELVGSGQAANPANAQRALFSGEVKVVAEPATNALLITADPSDMTAVDGIIDKLDVRRLQVLVEALIVEVSGNAIERFGVDWMSANGNVVGVQNFGSLGGVTGTGAALAANSVSTTPVSNAAVLAANSPSGLSLGFANSALSIAGLINAMESDGDANVLSTPNILTMDNEEAEIVVGKNVPFLTGQSSTQGGVSNPFQTIERKDVGLTLRVKPQISEGDTVRLELYQEISSVDGGTAAEGGLITSKRSIKTVVLTNDGEMIVLGGLMRDDVSDTTQRVPCLGSLPFIGEAFKFSNNTRTKTNLMVFLRPHIIKGSDDIQSITSEKYNNIRGLYEAPIRNGTIVFPKSAKEMPKDLMPTKGLKMEEAIQGESQVSE